MYIPIIDCNGVGVKVKKSVGKEIKGRVELDPCDTLAQAVEFRKAFIDRNFIAGSVVDTLSESDAIIAVALSKLDRLTT